MLNVQYYMLVFPGNVTLNPVSQLSLFNLFYKNNILGKNKKRTVRVAQDSANFQHFQTVAFKKY